MKHKDKLKLARKMNGNKKSGGFITPQWEARKQAIGSRVKKRNELAHKRALEKKQNKLKILDDKGKEHRVGEIFESKTLTLET